MPITSIKRDWGVDPCIVRMATTDDYNVITEPLYLLLQKPYIDEINAGNFEWEENDLVLISYEGGMNFFIPIDDFTALELFEAGPGGSVRSFSSGDLSPLFTTSVTSPTVNPHLSFSLSDAPANTYFGNGTSGVATPSFTDAQELTGVDDINVTITVGGTPLTALLQPVSLTLGWMGQLSLARGGTNSNLTPSNGGIVYSTATELAILNGTGVANRIVLSGINSMPSWSTAAYPSTTTINQLLYSSNDNVIAGLASAANGVLITGNTGIPSIGNTLPNAVQSNITAVGTIGSGVWQGTSISTTYTDAKVISISGVTNRTTVTGTTTVPIIDIAATYVGQSSITTLGTIGTGVWQGSSISTTYTDAKVISVTGTSNRITIGGTAGNPTVDIASNYVGQNTITTLGTIGTGIWQGTQVGIGFGGTGQTTANAAFNALAPSQTGNNGFFLTTNGTNTSWAAVSTVPSVSGQANKVLTNNGTSPLWSAALTALAITSSTIESTPIGLSTPAAIGATTVSASVQMYCSGPYVSNAGTAGGGILHYYLDTSNTLRWGIGLDVVESGANSGSNFNIWRYADNGSFLAGALNINRANGLLTVNSTTINSFSGGNYGLSINDTTSGVAAANFINFLAPNVTSGGVARIFYGVANSTNNQVIEGLYYAGSNSANSYWGTGFYNNESLLRLYTDGQVLIGSTKGSGPAALVITRPTFMQLNVGSTRGSNNDAGAYLHSSSADQALLVGGGYYNSSAWQATATTSSQIDMNSGNINFYCNTGLTAGNTYSLNFVGQWYTGGLAIWNTLSAYNSSGTAYYPVYNLQMNTLRTITGKINMQSTTKSGDATLNSGYTLSGSTPGKAVVTFVNAFTVAPMVVATPEWANTGVGVAAKISAGFVGTTSLNLETINTGTGANIGNDGTTDIILHFTVMGY